MGVAAQDQRLKELRARLSTQGLVAFVVPKSDEQQLEYVPAASDRLAWLTDFGGSAGMAIVAADRAALFTDGRYTEQAARQTNSPLWEQRHITKQPPGDWLQEVLSAGDALGYDPRLHTPAGLEWLNQAAEKGGFTLMATPQNPVDAIWSDRPPPPCGAVTLYPEAFAGETSAHKRGRMVDALKEQGVDALLVSDPSCLAWLLNIRGADLAHTPFPIGYALLTAQNAVTVFMDPAKWTDTTRMAVVRSSGPTDFAAPEALQAALGQFAGKTVRVDSRSASQWVVRTLEAGAATADVGDDPCSLAKACKTAAELEGIQAAHVRDGVALVRFLHWFDGNTPGEETEWTLVSKLAGFRQQSGRFLTPSFSTISGFGANGASPHYTVTPELAAPLEIGNLYLVDSGAQYLDGTTDITRVTCVGAPTDEMKLRYTQVLRGHIALARAQFPEGVTGSQLDPFARQHLWAAGVDYDHGTGHGVGCYLSVHEGPQGISKRPNTVPLLPGMVVSNEPGYYKPGAFGVRIENLVAVRALDPQPPGAEKLTLGFTDLSLCPYERRLIVHELLLEHERDWVDAYHQRVRDTLTPLLPADAARWLADMTRPLTAE